MSTRIQPPMATVPPATAAAPPAATDPPRGAPLTELGARVLARYGLLVVFAVLVAFFSIARPGTFFTTENAQTIASGQAVVALLALGAMVPLIVGQFDLSVGFQMGFAQTLCAGLIVKQHDSAIVACLVVIAVGVGFGLVNGLLVVGVGINAFVATLATGTLAAGITQQYSNGESIFGTMPSTFLDLGRNGLVGIPLPILYVLGAVIALWLVFEYTAWGRSGFAIGGNARAALIAGVRVKRMTIQCFVLAGVFASLAGILSTMILGSASPDVGSNFLLPAFAGAFLGATSIRPGRYNAWGTFLAVYLLGAGITGLQQMGAASYVEQYFNGGALLVAVALSRWAANRRRTRGLGND